jgi:hypothetical protein
VNAIGDWAFCRCSRLASLAVDERSTCFAGVDGVLFSKDMKTLLQYPMEKLGAEYAVPNTVKTIGKGAFQGCAHLVRVRIPDGVALIGKGAFQGCANLAAAVLPNSVQTIGEEAFLGCSRLASVVIPESVRTIGDCAFRETSLASVAIPSGVKTIGDFAFEFDVEIIREGGKGAASQRERA